MLGIKRSLRRSGTTLSYCQVTCGGLWPTWEVESDALEEKLAELNTYLERLGWMARLRRGDVNQLTTLPLSHRQFPVHVFISTCGRLL